MANIFTAVETQEPFVALTRNRNGYIMIAAHEEKTSYADFSLDLMAAAKAWATVLEQHGAARVYWIMLSEETPHLHMHLFPRWESEGSKGIALFEARNNTPQPAWTPELQAALAVWAKEWKVAVASA